MVSVSSSFRTTDFASIRLSSHAFYGKGGAARDGRPAPESRPALFAAYRSKNFCNSAGSEVFRGYADPRRVQDVARPVEVLLGGVALGPDDDRGIDGGLPDLIDSAPDRRMVQRRVRRNSGTPLYIPGPFSLPSGPIRIGL